ncbi:hypothetical protein [Streptomyces sp. GMR22]|uniref:hypothetical protein n=1 Tax=Streptomyces sp. GMR22 TaxID=2759524 RepID=UPI0015FE43E4|nr:hypothetical protein [Streptomyces sp. GMR22]MBA6440520.1 hypothetical protein [Streptomyces sp. GMR22]
MAWQDAQPDVQGDDSVGPGHCRVAVGHQPGQYALTATRPRSSSTRCRAAATAVSSSSAQAQGSWGMR